MRLVFWNHGFESVEFAELDGDSMFRKAVRNSGITGRLLNLEINNTCGANSSELRNH